MAFGSQPRTLLAVQARNFSVGGINLVGKMRTGIYGFSLTGGILIDDDHRFSLQRQADILW